MQFLKFIFSRLFLCLLLTAALYAAVVFLCVYIHSLLPAAAAICLSYLLSLTAAARLLSLDKSADSGIAWLALIIAFPIAGAVVCLLTHACPPEGGGARLFPPVPCADYEYFDDGEKFLKRLTELIRSSQKRVFLEFYIISKGRVWGEICDELQLAAERGVEVRILYDYWGSALRAPVKDFKKLKKAGAKIKVFNKLLPMPVSRINVRDHRKIAVIDDDAVFVGGVNIADEYAHLTSPHSFWKDGGALFYGQTAHLFSEVFEELFGDGERTERPRDGAAGNAPVDGTGGAYPAGNASADAGNARLFSVTAVADMPEAGGGVFEDTVASLVYNADRRVHIFTPYLCAGEKLCDALACAARRGVDVTLIIPAVPDKKLPYAITKIYAEKLSGRGVKVYAYTPGFMHFKGAVFDGTAYIGSYNFDFRSARLNYENGVFCTGGIAEEVESDFTACLALSRPIPEAKRGALRRTARSVLRLLAPLV